MSTAAAAPSSWSRLVAPMIGATMAGFARSQASATCAGVAPRAAAMARRRSTTAQSQAR
jgi:hypothetical protein